MGYEIGLLPQGMIAELNGEDNTLRGAADF